MSALQNSVKKKKALYFTSQDITPAFHPLDLACATQPAKVLGSMKPLPASPALPGLPMTSLLSGIPLAAIWNRADLGQVPEDSFSKPLQVVYSFDPSNHNVL